MIDNLNSNNETDISISEMEMSAAEKLEAEGYEDAVVFANGEYDSAFIGVTSDGRAVYDFDLMVEWCMSRDGMTAEEAVDWIEYNAIRSLPYAGEMAPIVLYRL